ncbi:MAG: MFS transporter [Actinomycetaceae bacterium]|nr:MFS transporter [Actinomycetaceae bacterium]
MDLQLPSSRSRTVSYATVATLITFFVEGAMLASFLSRIPTLRDVLELSPSQMGTLLLIGACGAVVSLPASGPIVGRFGPRNTVWASFAIWTLGMIGLITAFELGSVFLFAVFLFVMQSGTSLGNSTMNVESGYVELLAKRPIIPWFHAAFSIGTVIGAATGALVLYCDIDFAVHLAVVIVIANALMVWAGRNYIPQPIIDAMTVDDANNAARSKRAWRERRTVLAGVIVFGTGLMEGGANDWLALSMVDGFHMTSARGTAVLAMFLFVLTLTRILSPKLLLRWPADRVLRVLLSGSIIGLVMVSVSPWIAPAILAVALWAMGAALGFPIAASVLSKEPAMAAARMAVMSTLGYGAFLAGPPIIGYIAEYVGYRHALIIITIPVMISALLTPILRTPHNSGARRR